jgi:hypothetical protein
MVLPEMVLPMDSLIKMPYSNCELIMFPEILLLLLKRRSHIPEKFEVMVLFEMKLLHEEKRQIPM